jgi:hypothetical protein
MTDLEELMQMDEDTIQKKVWGTVQGTAVSHGKRCGGLCIFCLPGSASYFSKNLPRPLPVPLSLSAQVHQANSALVTLKANLESAEGKLKTAKREETVDSNTGISLDKSGNSMAKLNCLIINGRDMPVMNTFNGKSDAYCEVTLDPPSLCPSFKSAKSETQWGSLDPVFQMESVMSGLEGQVAEGRVKIEVYDDVENLEKLIKKKTLMGTVYLSLADLMDQEMHTDWCVLGRGGGAFVVALVCVALDPSFHSGITTAPSFNMLISCMCYFLICTTTKTIEGRTEREGVG